MFRSPLILGGQAARAGVSCETCHRNGRDNRDFQFPGISGAAGTADVTSSLFSSHRGNGVEDPRPIPDLSMAKARLKVSQRPEDRALEPFIHGLITQEFDGPEPSPAVLAGLAAYVRALSPEACPSAGTAEAVVVTGPISDVARAVAAAERARTLGDRPTEAALILSARSQMQQIDERFAGFELSPVRAALRAADARLAGHDLAGWRRIWDRLTPRLIAQAPRSLYDPARLAKATQAPLPPPAP